MAKQVRLDIEKTYGAILDAARAHRFVSYGDLAEASDVPWTKARRLIPNQLGQLATISHERGWPLLSAIVVTKENLKSGEIEGTALDGFLGAAEMVDIEVDDPQNFVRDQQAQVFDWAKSAPASLGLKEQEATSAIGGPRFVHYFRLVLDALRSFGGEASPENVYGWVKEHVDVSTEELTGVNKNGQSKFENKVAWARFYLAKAGLIDGGKRGVWTLTPEGRETRLDHESALEIFREVQARFRTTDDDDEPAPEAVSTESLFDDPARAFWFVGAVWSGTDDQLDRFIEEGIWQNGYHDKFTEHVLR